MGDASHTVLSDAEKHARLRLIRSEGVGPVSFTKLLSVYGSASEAIWHLLNAPTKIRLVADAEIEKEIAAHAALGATLLYLGEPSYPHALAAIPDAPPVLSVLGDATLLCQQNIAVVGARNASASGIKLRRLLCKGLADAGIIVTSGLARGIDAAAHAASVSKGTIACLAGGVDIIYPQDNSALYQEIAEHGALVSEMRLGTKPQARHFPRRNRIISGLSAGLLVIEAAKKSGSLITARFAADQGREVFAVPGSPLDPRAQGANQLIKDGATLVQTADDIVNELTSMPLLRASRGPMRQQHSQFAPKENSQSHAAPAYPKQSEHNTPYKEDTILSLLSPDPIHIDEIVRLSGTPIEKLLSEFMTLELMGDIKRHSGNRFSRNSP
ncbi:MAG: DNA-protecting protein DprA [Kordiimonadaceae bacterium]|nr:DNA-protecting protein DprA [Kordiimonadaceae bacterium]